MTDQFEVARYSRRLVEQQRERIATLEAENEQLRDSTKRIDAYWQSELRDCRNERDALRAELAAPKAPAEADGVKRWTLDVDCLYPSEEGGWCEYDDHLAALSAVITEREGLAAARIAYASEFAPDEHGDPDVGSVHKNIRALKAERDRINADRKACWEEFRALVKSSCEKERYLQEEIDQLRAEGVVLVEALEHARRFIRNGVELGYIQMPDVDTPDPAHETLPKIEAALAAHRAGGAS